MQTSCGSSNNDIWIWSFAQATLQRLTFDPGANRGLAWSPDGRRLAFSRALEGEPEEVYWQRADGSGAAEPLTTGSTRGVYPSDFSPDGSIMVFDQTAPPRDISIISVEGPPGAGESLLATPASESSGTISPDGRWLAYQSDVSGQPEVYVRPFPEVETGLWMVSSEGGTRPRWSRDGRELFYYVELPTSGALMAVTIVPGESFTHGPARRLFTGDYGTIVQGRQSYDVSADGQRFLMIKNADEGASQPAEIHIVLNWHQELKRLVPTD